MARQLYSVLLHLALPWLLLRLWWRGRKEPGYREEWLQRLGVYPARPHADLRRQPLIWLHAVSLGETRAAQPLVEALLARHPDHRLLITHMTATGRAAAQSLYGSKAELAWLPYDFTWAMARFYAYFQPGLGILMETEVWPNLARTARARGMPLILANARLSEKSLAGYRRAGALAREAFAGLIVAAQTEADAARIKRLGTQSVAVTGNLKFDSNPSAAATGASDALRRLFGTGRVFLAASTREGEEALLLDALTRTPLDASASLDAPAGAVTDALPAAVTPTVTVIVPRHPQRFNAVAALLQQRGIAFTRRSENRPLPTGCHVMLGDSLGEMPLYYAACDCAFIGGSLLPFGGQNLIEACAQGTPVLIGPQTFNFAEAADQAVAAGAALRVDSAAALVREVRTLLADGGRRARMGEAGRAFCASHRGATARTMEMIDAALSGVR